MRAAVYTRYGPPDVVEVLDIEKPVPGPGEVLIAVRASGLNPMECGIVRGGGRFVNGWISPRVTRLGVDVAGVVEDVGPGAGRFKPGDEVFGAAVLNPRASGVSVWTSGGALAEYVSAPESMLALKPENVSFVQAAAVPVAGLTALQALRGKARLEPGRRVLVNGASGGVGTFAVQISKATGAHVTGVSSEANARLVRSIGADDAIDYTRQDFTRGGERFDVLLDCICNHPVTAYRRILSRDGICLAVGGPHGPMLAAIGRILLAITIAFTVSKLTSRKLMIFIARPDGEDLEFLAGMMASGKITPVVDLTFPLANVREALRYVEKGHARGKVVVTLP